MNPFSVALRWYKKHGRDLPWRKTRDPYRILLSEIMLQQTQVDRVITYYHRWLKVFPNWHSLARAKKHQVIREWSGLGYNRRALFLKSAAESVASDGLPQSENEWLQLKGVGRYTARAVSAFSQKVRALPIDTNIRRILGRVLLGKPFPTEADDGRIEREAMKRFPKRGHYYDIPQALFDLASLYCTKTPNCAECPLQKSCKSAPKFLSGKVRIPKRSVQKTRERIRPGKKYPDRIYRGRILQLVKNRERVRVRDIGKRIDPNFTKADQVWLQSMIQRLETDGLIAIEKDAVRLPRT